jgi:predicted AlkP superfamily pyrophosphatase or phosphodiesterase
MRSVPLLTLSLWLAAASLARPGFSLATPPGPNGRPLQETSRRAAGSPPHLVVVLVVDQMRSDYIDSYGSRWTGGLKRLVDGGARFPDAAYPYLNTVTCPGHATISTGRFPASHGTVLNEWWDRRTARRKPCTVDPATKTVGAQGPIEEGHSVRWLRGPTLADVLAERREGRIVSVSLKPRSAVMLAGRHGDLVTWFNDAGAWVTSTAFAPRLPPVLLDLLKRRPVEEDRGRSWVELLDDGAYSGPDDVAEERPLRGWGRTFPHALDPPNAEPASRFHTQWAGTPFADEYVAQIAVEAIDQLQLGRRRGTDFLGVSFSALDRVGHAFGPRSHEVQDLLLRLDRTIGRLLGHLDERLGGDYVLALSADHGVAPIPEQASAEGFEAGRLASARLADRVNLELQRQLGPRRYVEAMLYTDLYFTGDVWSMLLTRPYALQAAMEALATAPGVAHVFRGDELPRARSDADPVRRAAALSYFPGRSGDLIMVPKANWITSADATTHGTLQPYDQRVPLVLFGARVKAGVYRGTASPADIAPTLAQIARAPLRGADGRVLIEALAQPGDGKEQK